jgi:hypothetical protein
MSKFCDTCSNSGKIVCQDCRVTPPGLPTSYRKESVIKPPLGLTPKCIWRLQRVQDISEAIERYTAANKAIPLEWVEEFNSLVE